MIIEPLAVIDQALGELPEKMTSDRAKVMLVAIGLQESRFEHRRQLGNGPAMGFWQFERGGGVAGVLRHAASKALAEAACARAGVRPIPMDVWLALEHKDVLAATLARLLLWTDPRALPEVNNADGAWQTYIRNWRPGKPHPQTWARFHKQSVEMLK